jgi:hypothetical protein
MMTLEEMQRQRTQDNQTVMPLWECAMRLELVFTQLDVMLTQQKDILRTLRQLAANHHERPKAT